jgi:putative membrane protein
MSSEHTGQQPPSGGRVRRFALRYWTAIILVALAAIFIAQNRDRPRVHILWITVQSPIWFILTVMLVVGVLIGLLLRRRRR